MVKKKTAAEALKSSAKRQPTKGRGKQPKRMKMSDRILHGQMSADEQRCDYAVAPFDRAALEMDRKWGIDVLPELVSAETAERYGSAMAKLNAAIDSNDPEEVLARVGVCARGMAVMDAEATASGAARASVDVWEVDGSDATYAVLRDGRSWQALDREGVVVVTMREVAVALDFMAASKVGEFKAVVEANFGNGAEIMGVTPKLVRYDDEIPF